MIVRVSPFKKACLFCSAVDNSYVVYGGYQLIATISCCGFKLVAAIRLRHMIILKSL